MTPLSVYVPRCGPAEEHLLRHVVGGAARLSRLAERLRHVHGPPAARRVPRHASPVLAAPRPLAEGGGAARARTLYRVSTPGHGKKVRKPSAYFVR